MEEDREIFRQVEGGFLLVDEDYLDQVERKNQKKLSW